MSQPKKKAGTPDLEEQLFQHLTSFHTAPFLFVGSGISRRYLGLEDWQGLLRHFAELTDRPYEYYRASGAGYEPAIASEIARELHSIWWQAKKFENSRSQYRTETLNRESALKIEISRYLESKSTPVRGSAELDEELRLLQTVTVDGIITTNWDLFLELMFPDFRVYVGQEELLFSATQGIGELYKIHGCCSKPNSLVATSADYQKFNQRNPYLAAKLLTVFAEHPIVFMGYALNDQNISEILQSIASCLTTQNIDQLRDRLVLIQWNPEERNFRVQDSTIVTDGYNIPVKTIITSNLTPIYRALGRLARKFPAALLRRLRQHVYELVKDKGTSRNTCLSDRFFILDFFC
jgi:SIR2-like domain